METEAWFDVVTSVIDVEGEVQNALSRNVGDEKDVNAWFDREMSKVKLPPGIAPMKSVKSTQRTRRRQRNSKPCVGSRTRRSVPSGDEESKTTFRGDHRARVGRVGTRIAHLVYCRFQLNALNVCYKLLGVGWRRRLRLHRETRRFASRWTGTR
jgi:hypothetical protein